ncbi:MAG: hypothetical protein ACLTC4_19725 [Hungatella hathewayi]
MAWGQNALDHHREASATSYGNPYVRPEPGYLNEDAAGGAQCATALRAGIGMGPVRNTIMI